MTRRRRRELRLVPIPLSVVRKPAGSVPAPAAGPSGGNRPRRVVRQDEFWSVAFAMLASNRISDAEFIAIVGATAVVPLDD